MIKLEPELELVLNKIEKMRKQLRELEKNKGLLDKQVLRKSEELDELINEYYRLHLKNNNSVKKVCPNI